MRFTLQEKTAQVGERPSRGERDLPHRDGRGTRSEAANCGRSIPLLPGGRRGLSRVPDPSTLLDAVLSACLVEPNAH